VVGGRTGFEIQTREETDTKESVNGKEHGLKPTANHDIIFKIFLSVGFSVCIYSSKNSEKLKRGDKC
jgi:hypothetical protein